MVSSETLWADLPDKGDEMKYLVKVFGAAILCALVVYMGWAIVYHVPDAEGHEGVFEIIGAQIEGIGGIIADGAFESYKNESMEDYPVINCLQTGNLASGRYVLGELVSAKDCTGNVLAFSVKIKAPGDVQWYEHTGADEVDFTSRGIYVLLVETKDADGRKTVSRIALPVN